MPERMCLMYLWTFHEGQPPGFARDNRDGPFHISDVLVGVVLQQVLDEGCLANARGAVHDDDIGWRLFWGCVHDRDCKHTDLLLSNSISAYQGQGSMTLCSAMAVEVSLRARVRVAVKHELSDSQQRRYHACASDLSLLIWPVAA